MSAAVRKNWADEASDSSDDDEVVEETPVVEPKLEQQQTQPREQGGRREYNQERGNRGNNRDNRESRPQRERNIKPPSHPPFKAFMSNLAFKVTEREIREFFNGGKCPCTKINMRMDRENPTKPDGSCIVEFNDAATLSQAMNAHDEELKGRKVHIRVFEDYSESRGNNRNRRDNGRDNDKSEWNRGTQHKGGDRKERTDKTANTSSSASTRPKLDLKPRTAPLSTDNSATNSAIFGEGRARVETSKAATEAPASSEAASSEKDAVKEDKEGKYVAKGPKDKKGGKTMPTNVFSKALKDAHGTRRSGKAQAAELTPEQKFEAAQKRAENAEAGMKEKEKAAKNKNLRNNFASLMADDDSDEN